MKSAKLGFGIATDVGKGGINPGKPGMIGGGGGAAPEEAVPIGSRGDKLLIVPASLLGVFNPESGGGKGRFALLNCLCKSDMMLLSLPRTRDMVRGVIRVSVTL